MNTQTRSLLFSLCLCAPLMGCDAAANRESAFLVTAPSTDGMVSVLAAPGTVVGLGAVTIQNKDLQVSGDTLAESNGGVWTSFSAQAGDALVITWQDPTGQRRESTVSPDEDTVLLRGVLEVNDPDGAEGPLAPCFVLVTQPGKKGPPPCNQPPEGAPTPSADGTPAPGEAPEAGGPPPGGQGGQGPQGGQGGEPPAGTPPEGAPTPDAEGNRPPPPAVLLVGAAVEDTEALMALVGQRVNVAGQPAEPTGEEACPLPPFSAELITADEGAEGHELQGVLEQATVSTSEGSTTCTTFRRVDLDPAGQDPHERVELVGDAVSALESAALADGTVFWITGAPSHALTPCGFPGFELSSWRTE